MGAIKVRKYHQAKWDEPIIFQLSTPGEIGITSPYFNYKKKINVPDKIRRDKLPNLPEISQSKVLGHYLRLSQETIGGNIFIHGEATCTMKYNPKINDLISRSPKVAELHPLQPVETVQGSLEIMYSLDLFLREISGFDKYIFQPASGSQSIYTMASIIYKYHKVNKNNQKNEIITTLLSHPSNHAASKTRGFKVIDIPPDPETGLPDIEAFKNVISKKTAGLIICNPEDTEIFNPKIKEITKMLHEAEALCAYDQANVNGLLGLVRAKDMGFDMGFFNLHKAFSSPHGSGGPGSGAVGVIKDLVEFLPVPTVEYDQKNNFYYLDYNLKYSIGKIREFYGNFNVIIRAYAWIMSLGEKGLREVSKISILNNAYLTKKILSEIKGVDISFPKSPHRVSQTRFTFKKLYDETGITVDDLSRRLADFGFHTYSSHHPWVIPEPFSYEPVETYSKDEIDEFIETLKLVVKEAYENPKFVKNAPYQSSIHKLKDLEMLNDYKKWIPTWRIYFDRYLKEIK